ncbi:pyridoxamine 5'-phosphate oxidase family protein [Pseudomonas sp. NA-150]|uniref:2Fe-2S iron-sulfur cluster-binding protein n=1 Tax=Pseudomonas sp. NA-150 TaxID=3367525 RepID=UPI0037CB73E4
MNTHLNATADSPWHAGELAIQQSVGVVEQMHGVGLRNVRDHLIEQHQQFYPLLPFVALATVDQAGDVWATLRTGEPGFASAIDAGHLQLQVTPDSADPAEDGLQHGEAIGLLGIDLMTRRRNRLNGTIVRDQASALQIAVSESFGNCPRYIELQQFSFSRPAQSLTSHPVQWLDQLDDAARALIAGASTFFVGSYVALDDGSRKVDASHRGGKPGFVRLNDDGSMTIPDFSGNLFFNTLGNLLANPKAGLVFIDFVSGELLQMTGDAEVILDSPDIASFQGAERLWQFKPRRILRRVDALTLRWAPQAEGASPNSLMTGSWEEVAQRQQAAALANTWRPLRVRRIHDESRSIRSFELEPADGLGLIAHAAGQHLPIRVSLPGHSTPLIRSYTLSTAPSDSFYRISVKRQGPVSMHLHENLQVGDLIDTRAPAGAFTLNAAEKRPAVLLAAGVGITPMIAMLRHIVFEGTRTRHKRKTWLIHGARSLAERAFDHELSTLIKQSLGTVKYIRSLTDTEGAVLGEDYEAQGRVSIDLLRSTLPFDDYDFYLCGPSAFMQGLYDELRGLNVADRRIHAEGFGPASLQRQPDQGAVIKALPAIASASVPVMFLESGKEERWEPGAGSLLELAEERGLAPEYGCRTGSCGTCRTRILKGAVTYTQAPDFVVDDNEALICCAMPAASEDGQQVLHLAL